MIPSEIIYQSYNYLTNVRLAHWILSALEKGECGRLSPHSASLVPGLQKGLTEHTLNEEGRLPVPRTPLGRGSWPLASASLEENIPHLI